MTLTRKIAFLQQAAAFQWLPPQVLRRYQQKKIASLLSFCERNVPLYRETFRGAGVRARDFRELPDLAYFPTVTREQIVEAYPEGILSRPIRPNDMVFRTSGTSGLFMQIAYSARANDFLDAIYARALFATGYRPWHRIAYFWSEDKRRGESLYERLGLMRKALMPVDPDPAVQLERLRSFAPHFVYHFPSSMMMIARIIRESGRRDIHPRGIICHGEFMPQEIQQELQRVFQCPVWNQYGAQEVNRIGWDCQRHEAFHQDADSICLEVLDNERVASPGEEGEIVLTGLHNRLMPLVRYRLGDAGRTVPGKCPCGRGLPRFELTEGRIDDVVTLGDGRRIGPRVLAPEIEKLHGFSQYRFIQKEPDRFSLLVVKEQHAPADLEDSLRHTVTRVMGDRVTLDIEPVESIPLSRRGKLRKVISELATNDDQPDNGAPSTQQQMH